MKNLQPESLREGDPSGPTIRSQKNITTSLAFHLKTEYARGEDENASKSPDAARNELRETCRRPQLPSKLLQVFNQQKQKKKYGSKITQGTIQNIDKLVQHSKYKQTQKQLEPLKPKQEKKDGSENRNLFNPMKKMQKMVDKFTEQIMHMSETSADRFIGARTGPKISECITLEIIKRGHSTGVIKKMLHIPTLTFVCVREEPCTQKQTRNLIREWTNLWRQKLTSESSSFVTIFDVLYNHPQGAISIFMEYFKSRSLLNLLDLTATLPESVIHEIFVEILPAMEKFYSLTGMAFGGLSPSQIMFTQQNKVKISLGIFYHIPNLESYNIYHIKSSSKQKPFDFNNTITKFMKSSSEKQTNIQNQKSVDIFKLGLIALNCAIGNFENYQQSSSILEAIKYVFTQEGQIKVDLDNACCLLHSEKYLLQMSPTNLQNQKTQRKPEQKTISYIKLIKDRFSINFVQFLCQCLKLHHGKRATLMQIQNSAFILNYNENDNKCVKVDLQNIMAIGRGLNQSTYQSGSFQKLDNFVGLLRPALMYCNKQSLKQLITNQKDRMYEIGNQIGLNSKAFGKKMQELVLEILKR